MKPVEQAYANGWTDLVMIGKGKKYPTFKGWQNFQMTDNRLALAIEHGYDTYGMLAAYHPGVDIDITDLALVKQIRELAFEMLGPTPIRTGYFPKCLLPYNTLEPFPKRTLKIWRKDDMERPWLVEVLGDGQQYVLLGLHPDTGNEYLWTQGSPLTTSIDDLPMIDADMVSAFLQAVADKFDPSVWTVQLSGAKSPTQTTVNPDTLAAPSIKDVRELVAGTPNPAFLRWNEMMNFGRAIKGATRGSEEGMAIFQDWCYRWEGGASDDKIHEKVWQGEPTVGWDWLLKLATDHGASTIAFDFDVISDEVVESVITSSSFKIDDVATADGVASWMARNDFFDVAYVTAKAAWCQFLNGRWVIPPGNHRGAAYAYPAINRALETLHAWLSEQPMPPKSAPRIKMLGNLKSTIFKDRVRAAMVSHGAWSIDLDVFDDPLATNHLLNTPEGTYDLDLYEMRAHDPLDYITKQTKVSPKFDDKKMPVWLDMLKRVTNNADEIDFLQRYLGSSLSGETANKIMLAIYGPSNSCKSTITDTIATNVLGVGHREYAAVAGENIILRRPQTNFDQHPTGLNTIRNARFAISHEGGEGMRWSENVIKRLTGGDALSTRALFSDGDTKRFYGRLIATANLLPQTDFVDSGMRERLVIMSLEAIPEGERKDLRDVIESEAPYILGWLIAGHHKNLERPVHHPEFIPASIIAETKELLEEGDPVRAFVATVIVFNDDGDVSTTSTTKLFDTYLEFCQSKSFSNPIHTVVALGRALKDMVEMKPYYHSTSAVRGYRVHININAMKRLRDGAIDDLIGPQD